MIVFYDYLHKLKGYEDLKDKEQNFKKLFYLIQIGANKLYTHIKARSLIHIVSHLDADGLSSAGQIIKFLKEKEVPFQFTVLKQVNEDTLKTLEESEADLFLFLDFGSQTELMEKFALMKRKDFLIVDHHQPKRQTFLLNINPYYCDLNGEIACTSTLTYFLINFIEDLKDFSYLALVGAIGDMQEEKGEFRGLNKLILDEAVERGIIEIKKEINLYGINILNLEEVLYRANLPFLPDFGSVVNLLTKLDLLNKNYLSLTKEEKEKLHKVLITLLSNYKLDIDTVFGKNYYLKGEENPYLANLKTYATFLNACGRLNKIKEAIGVILNLTRFKQKINEVMKEYKEEIKKALEWFEKNKENKEKIFETEDYLIINAEDNIKETLIGTLASVLINQTNKKGIISIAKEDKDNYKISIRTKEEEVPDLVKKLSKFGEFGGHKKAGGGRVKQATILEFIEYIKSL